MSRISRPHRKLEKVALDTIRRERMLEEGDRVVVAVSGGPDSVALLHFLDSLRKRMRLELFVFHLDHMLRGEESREDSRYVARLAGELDIPARVLAHDVRASSVEKNLSPQERARLVRLALLEEYADDVGASRIATGHTADDQVETFLMRIIQGAGITGLASMRPVSGRYIRPLVCVWRDEVERYCELVGATPRTDSSNLRYDYLRNRVRHNLIPALVSGFGEGTKGVILKEIESIAQDADYLALEARRAFELVVVGPEGPPIRLDAAKMEALHPALMRGVLREAWRRLRPGAQALSWSNITDVVDKVLFGRTGASLDLRGGAVARREYGCVLLSEAEDLPAEPGPEKAGPVPLAVPGSAVLPGLGMRIEAEEVQAGEVVFDEDASVAYLSGTVGRKLEVRTPLPGDRFFPLGAPGSRKLKDFFIDRKVPREERWRTPLVLSGDRIVWVVGYRIDESARVNPADQGAARLQARRI